MKKNRDVNVISAHLNNDAVIHHFFTALDRLAGESSYVTESMKNAPAVLVQDRSFQQIAADDLMDLFETYVSILKLNISNLDIDSLPLESYQRAMAFRSGESVSEFEAVEQLKHNVALRLEHQPVIIGNMPDFLMLLKRGTPFPTLGNVGNLWAEIVQGLSTTFMNEEGLICKGVADTTLHSIHATYNAWVAEDPSPRGQRVSVMGPSTDTDMSDMDIALDMDMTVDVGQDIDVQAREDIARHNEVAILRARQTAAENVLYEIHKRLKMMGEETEDDTQDLEERIKAAGLPPEVLKEAQKVFKTLYTMPASSPEVSIHENYLELLADLPWDKSSDLQTDIEATRSILDEDHYGMDKIKQAIVEHVAVQNHTHGNKGEILCFVGPPGVGKTSIGASIARGTGRKFIRIALGGLRDEGEIRGHRRTYVGAMPGNIIQNIRASGVKNPLILLDEIDKLGNDTFRGDPSAAFLEVLDPAQNHTFKDHYLGVPYDLSKVLFVCTANDPDRIPAALKDRMRMIHLRGYTPEEKIHIARRYLIPKQMREHNLTTKQFKITESALKTLIDLYTREAGVRDLERKLGELCKKAVLRLNVKQSGTPGLHVTKTNLNDLLGMPMSEGSMIPPHDTVGSVTGLAWTPVGGVTLPIEARVTKGKNFEVQVTGQLRDVMKESVSVARTVIRSLTDKFNAVAQKPDDIKVHIHALSAAIPKDGPSAGAAMAVVLASVIMNAKVRRDVALTGELSLLGKILPIGGLVEKLSAAHREGIRMVLIPKGNQKDLADVPKDILDRLDIRPVDTIEEVLDLMLADNVFKTPSPHREQLHLKHS